MCATHGDLTFIWFSRRFETLSQGELKLHSTEQEACQGYLWEWKSLSERLWPLRMAISYLWERQSLPVWEWQSLICENGNLITMREVCCSFCSIITIIATRRTHQTYSQHRSTSRRRLTVPGEGVYKISPTSVIVHHHQNRYLRHQDESKNKTNCSK